MNEQNRPQQAQDSLEIARLMNFSNPLLEEIPYISLAKWSDTLTFNPLQGIDLSALSEEWQTVYVELVYQRFAATATAIQIASSLQAMMRTSYVLRNPTLIEQKRRLVDSAKTRGLSAPSVAIGAPLVWGKVIKGITGLGKSAIVHRALSHLPLTIEHGKCDAADWTSRVQIPVLGVAMPATRGGLLFAILEKIDELVGTTYKQTYARWTVDRLLLEVVSILEVHYVGLLIIEEIQVRNFAGSPFREELFLFFLRLLNHGIPVVLVGNTMGFVRFDEFSQDIRRLTRSDPVELNPAPSVDDEEWDKDIAPAIWSYGGTGSTPYHSVRDVVWRQAGGIPDFAATIRGGMLRIRMHGGSADRATLEKLCAESEQLKKNRELIDGLVQRDLRKLSQFADVPWEDYGLRWGISLEDILSAGQDAGQMALDPKLDSYDVAALAKAHGAWRARASREVRSTRKPRSSANGAAAAPVGDPKIDTVASRNLVASLASLKARLASQANKRAP